MGRRLEYEVKTSVRFNMNNPQHVKINNVLQNLDPNIFKSKNQFIIDACQFYIDHYGEEQFMEKKERKRESYISVEDIDEIKAELIEVAMNEARKEAIERMQMQAQKLGANAVINVRFATSAITAGAAEVYAYGTAVKVEPAQVLTEV